MITLDNIKELMHILNSPNDDLIYEVSLIVFYIDVFKFGDQSDISNHIDIHYSFGEYEELNEGQIAYNYIYDLCGLSEVESHIAYNEEFEKILYTWSK